MHIKNHLYYFLLPQKSEGELRNDASKFSTFPNTLNGNLWKHERMEQKQSFIGNIIPMKRSHGVILFKIQNKNVEILNHHPE